MFALALTLMTGCWTFPDTSGFDVVPFDSAVAQTTTGVVSTVETNLDCPDGEKARFYIVYDEAITEPAPVAIVFHSSAFDYVISPQPDSPLIGASFAGAESRISWSWGVRKVWETFGLHEQIEASEANLGTLPAALLDAGVVGIYPINCWGDYWHNARGTEYENDVAAEYIERNGGTFAWWMIRMLFESSFADTQGISIPPAIDTQQIHLVGLGDGGRGVIDLLSTQDFAPASVLLDSPIDDLTDLTVIPEYNRGLARIFAYDANDESTQPDWRYWSMWWMIQRVHYNGPSDFPAIGDLRDNGRLALVYSSNDPQIPAGNLDPFAAKLTGADGEGDPWIPDPERACAMDLGRAGHVFTNSDQGLAREIVDFMVDGTRPASCE
ncbi:MAG: hypothetical protein H6741_30155 [Alphaproteobacteria bacterium]|nr:hypothetical protein [Alphaproteobacteria bacterium]